MTPIKLDYIRQVMSDKGYKFHNSGAFHINLIAIRSNNSRSDAFDDNLHVAFRDDRDHKLKQLVFEINTCPGKHWTNAFNIHGVQLMAPNQYRDAYRLARDGKDGQVYLKQAKGMLFVEDHKFGTPDFGLYGSTDLRVKNAKRKKIDADLVPHTTWKKALGINYYRGGLQVMKSAKSLDIVTQLCDCNISAGHGLFFNYTLLEEKDFK